MTNKKRNQDYAEDMDFSQSDDMEMRTLDDYSSDDVTKSVKQLAVSADTIVKHTEKLGLTVDGIGRYLLNEDGTVRDFTNAQLMNDTAKHVDEGVQKMTNHAASFGEKIDKMPVEIDATFTGPSFEAIRRLNRNLVIERIIFVVAAVIIFAFAGYTYYRYARVAEQSDKLTRWYDENREAILFGQYLRIHENQRWSYWHKEWVNDPNLEKNMYDYYLLEELKSDKAKK